MVFLAFGGGGERQLGGMLGNRHGGSEGRNLPRYKIKGASSGQCILQIAVYFETRFDLGITEIHFFFFSYSSLSNL